MAKTLRVLIILTSFICYGIAPAGTIIIQQRNSAVDDVWQQLILDTVRDDKPDLYDRHRRNDLRSQDDDLRRPLRRPYQSEALREWRRELLNPW
jgi:hypothetical protein